MGQMVVAFVDVLAATAVLTVLLGLSGAAIGAFVGWLGAKELAWSWGAALLFSLALMPALLSLITRFLSLDAALATQVALALLGIPAARKMERPSLSAACGLLVFAVFVAIELGDFRWGDKLYQGIFALDMVKHVATINSILSWGLPLTDPFVSRAEPAGYYYFFYTLAAMPVRLTFGLLDARAAMGASVVLVAAGVLALAALLQRKVVPNLPAAGGVSLLAALLLCGNLDIVANILIGLASHRWPIEIEWWNEQIAPWLFSLLWVPHHVLGLIAGVFGLLIISERPGAASAVIGAIAFASCAGASVWVGLAVALTAFLWLISLIVRGHTRPALMLAAAGCLAGLLLVPLALDILHGRSGEGIPIGFTIRSFPALLVTPGLFHNVVSLLLLPLNYFIGFGVFAAGAVMFWRDPCSHIKTEAARILVLAAAAGLLLGSFTQSTALKNDLGWRVMLLPQLASLVWTSAVILARRGTFRIADIRKWPAVMVVLLMIGYAGNIYELVSVRAYPWLEPNVIFVPHAGFNPDIDGELAAAYAWANDHVARDAVLQHNPAGDERILPFGLYGRNRVAVADSESTIFGAPRAEVDSRIAAIAPIFTAPHTAAEVRARAEGIDVLVVSSADPVWSDRNGWVWSTPVLFALPHVRLIATRDLVPER
ncbi:MAG: hypothetical protein JO328_20070 [Hyphomicrobiales bacterium]|nr:hypothetical protein [Hyphomicrobiales bacterium]MBV9426863.1 hypothetical protein [Bradyrhizobiaceae bacterium]